MLIVKYQASPKQSKTYIAYDNYYHWLWFHYEIIYDHV